MPSSNIPANASEWPYPQYLIHRYPSNIEYCDYDGSQLGLYRPQAGDCLRAIDITYIYNRLEQMLGCASASGADYDEEYTNALDNRGVSSSGCLSSIPLEYAAILLKDITKHRLVSTDKAEYAEDHDFGDNSQAYHDATQDLDEKIISDLSRQCRDNWIRPHFMAGDCMTASSINYMVQRANSLKYRYEILSSLVEFSATFEQGHTEFVNTICEHANSTEDYKITSGYVSQGGQTSKDFYNNEDGLSLPTHNITELYRNSFASSHGYVCGIHCSGTNVTESHSVELTMIVGVEETKYETFFIRDDISEQNGICRDEGGQCGTWSEEHNRAETGARSTNTYSIKTIKISGDSVRIGDYYYAIRAEDVIAQVLSLVDNPNLGSLEIKIWSEDKYVRTGCCELDTEYNCCSGGGECPDGCKESGCVDPEEEDEEANCKVVPGTSTLCRQKYNGTITTSIASGFGDRSYSVKIVSLASFIMVEPKFLQL